MTTMPQTDTNITLVRPESFVPLNVRGDLAIDNNVIEKHAEIQGKLRELMNQWDTIEQKRNELKQQLASHFDLSLVKELRNNREQLYLIMQMELDIRQNDVDAWIGTFGSAVSERHAKAQSELQSALEKNIKKLMGLGFNDTKSRDLANEVPDVIQKKNELETYDRVLFEHMNDEKLNGISMKNRIRICQLKQALQQIISQL